MGQARIKTFRGIVFFAVWILFLAFFKTLKTAVHSDPARFTQIARILLLYLNIPIFFIWLWLGFGFGLTVTFVTCLAVSVSFRSDISFFPIVSIVIISFAAFRLGRAFRKKIKELEVAGEETEERLNLLRNEYKHERNDNARLRSSLKRIARLKDIIEHYNRTVSEEDVLDAIAKDSFGQFEGSDRALLYLVDTQKQELKLARSRKNSTGFPVKTKKGDVFDRWVLKHRIPLLVEDVQRDFRFSLDEELERDTGSVIIAPLASEQKILGVLRIDSSRVGNFTQSDLRLLDIIADLSGVSLQNAILYKKIEDLAIHDSLTGLFVHKYFIERLESELERAIRNNTDLSLLMLDLDNFKIYNDTYGHNAGDLVLKHIGSILGSFVLPGDTLARYGGEEFTLLLPNKDKTRSLEIAEDIRKAISRTPIILRRERTEITVSIGVASSLSEAKEAGELLRLVDSRLYNAKKRGKNTVCAE